MKSTWPISSNTPIRVIYSQSGLHLCGLLPYGNRTLVIAASSWCDTHNSSLLKMSSLLSRLQFLKVAMLEKRRATVMQDGVTFITVTLVSLSIVHAPDIGYQSLEEKLASCAYLASLLTTILGAILQTSFLSRLSWFGLLVVNVSIITSSSNYVNMYFSWSRWLQLNSAFIFLFFLW